MNQRTRLVVAIAVFTSLAACGHGRHVPAAVLRYPIVEEPPTLDPARMQDVYVYELIQNVYEGLVTFDANNKPVPALAERWDVSPDGRVYTFHLRANARFHHGRAVTSADFKYSMERALAPQTKSPTAANYLSGIVGVRDVIAGRRKDIAGVETPDGPMLVIRLERPMAYFLGKIAYPTAYAVCREKVEANGGLIDESAAIGTGPYMVSEYRHGAKLVLTANPDYWGGRPKVDRIERPIVLDPQTAHSMYENGEIDAVVPALSEFKSDQNNSALKSDSHLLNQANIFYLVMHPRLQPAFRDKRVRQAIARVIDRDELSRVAYFGTSPRIDSFIPPGLAGSLPDVRRFPLDPDDARKLLAQAGYPGGKGFPVLTLVYPTHQDEWRAMALMIREKLKNELGITVNLEEHEMGTFWTDTSDKEKVPFYITGWTADYPDTQDFLSTLLRTGAPYNHVGYSNSAFDALCDRADTEMDPHKRTALYTQADEIAMSEVAILPLVVYHQPILVKSRVRNWTSNLITFLLPHKQTRIVTQ